MWCALNSAYSSHYQNGIFLHHQNLHFLSIFSPSSTTLILRGKTIDDKLMYIQNINDQIDPSYSYNHLLKSLDTTFKESILVPKVFQYN